MELWQSCQKLGRSSNDKLVEVWEKLQNDGFFKYNLLEKAPLDNKMQFEQPR